MKESKQQNKLGAFDQVQTQAQADETEEELEALLRRKPERLQELKRAAPAPWEAGGKVFDEEMIRTLVRTLRILIFGYTQEELDAMGPQNAVEMAENQSAPAHSEAARKLLKVANGDTSPPVPTSDPYARASRLQSIVGVTTRTSRPGRSHP